MLSGDELYSADKPHYPDLLQCEAHYWFIAGKGSSDWLILPSRTLQKSSVRIL